MPVDVTGLTSGAINISSGNYSACVVMSTGIAKCWGDGSSGQLGNGTTTNSSTLIDVGEPW